MSIASLPPQGLRTPPWFQAGAPRDSTVNGTPSPSSPASTTASTSAGPQVTGTSNSFQALTQDLQAFLVQLQAGGGATAAANASTRASAGGPPPPDGGDGDSDGTSGASQSQGHHHHHPFDTQETGSGDASQSLASSGATEGGAGTASPLLATGTSLQAALNAYAATTDQNEQPNTLVQNA